MEQLIIIFVLFAIGLLLQRSQRFPPNSSAILNQFAIYISLPALILSKIPFLDPDVNMWQPVILAWLSMIIGIIFVLITAKLFQWSKDLTIAMLVVIPLGNTSFVGYPMIQAIVGEQGIPSAILFDQLGTFIALVFYGPWMIAQVNNSANVSIIHKLKKPLLFPPLWGLLCAFLFSSFLKHPSINEPLVLIGKTLVPIVIIALGMQFKLKIPSHNIRPLFSGLIIKLAIMPLMIFIFASLFGWQGLSINVSILESGMSSMISAGAIVMAAGLAKDLVPALISWGLLISFVTIPSLYWLLTNTF